MKRNYKIYYKTVIEKDQVKVINQTSGNVSAVYDPATDTLQMKELVTIAESTAILNMVRKAAGKINPDFESSRTKIELKIKASERAVRVSIVLLILLALGWAAVTLYLFVRI